MKSMKQFYMDTNVFISGLKPDDPIIQKRKPWSREYAGVRVLKQGLNTHTYTDSCVAHKTITISEEAYDALAKMKKERESFTDVILRVASSRGSASSLLRSLREIGHHEELARNIEASMKRTRKAQLRRTTV